MAIVTGICEQGNSTASLSGDVFVCEPILPEQVLRSGNTNTWHMWHAKVDGEVGETVRFRLDWPEYKPELLSDELKHLSNYEPDWNSFVRAARDVIFMSADRLNWTRIEDVTLIGNSLFFEAVLESATTYFTVTLYYTPTRYANLVQSLADNRFVRTLPIGIDDGGETIYAFEATDRSIPDCEKTRIYFEGAIHCSEFNGAHLCDYMLRFLASGNDEARELMRRFIFCIVPVVSLSSLNKGLNVHSSGINPNRDWVKMTLPSTKAVHGYLSAMDSAPTLLFDIHTGLANYGSWETCQALSLNPDLPEAQVNEMRRFIDLVYENCDFLPTRRYWISSIEDSMFDGYGMRYGITYTMEISHYAIYDRGENRHFPIDQARLERFAQQLLMTVGLFFEKVPAWHD